MTLSPRTEANIATLTPATQAMARKFLAAIAESNRLPAGFTVEIIAGTRTFAQQDALFQQGRFGNPGRIVTNARGGFSNHNFGIAFDIGIFDGQRRYVDDLPDQFAAGWNEVRVSRLYRSLGPVGKGLGLTWGGDWIALDDEPHWEMNLWPELSEDDKLQKLRDLRDAGETVA